MNVLKPSLFYSFLLFSIASWAQWQPYGSTFDPSNSNEYISKISSRDSTYLWALIGNEDGAQEMAWSGNGGKTFSKKRLPLDQGFEASCIWAINQSSAIIAIYKDNFLSSGSGQLLTTSDTGKTWKTLFKPSDNLAIENIHFFTPDIGIFFNGANIGKKDTLKVYRTVNGGKDWAKLNIPVLNRPSSDYEIKITNYYALGDKYWISDASGNILISVDQGHSWQVNKTNLPLKRYIETFAFKDSLNAIGISNAEISESISNLLISSELYKTTDGGKSWQKIDFNLTKNDYYYYTELIYDPSSKQYLITGVDLLGAFFGSLRGTNWMSTESGLQWKRLSNTFIADIEAVSGVIFGGGLNLNKNGLYRWKSPIVTKLALLKNDGQIRVFPTLFNNSLTLDYNTSTMSDLELQLSDMNGRILIQNKYFTSGNNSINLFPGRLHNLTEGTYFLKVINKRLQSYNIFKLVKSGKQ